MALEYNSSTAELLLEELNVITDILAPDVPKSKPRNNGRDDDDKETAKSMNIKHSEVRNDRIWLIRSNHTHYPLNLVENRECIGFEEIEM